MYAITILIAAIFYFLIFFMLKEEKTLRDSNEWKVVGKAKLPLWFWLLCFVLLFVPFVNAIGFFALLAFFMSTIDKDYNYKIRYTLFGLHLTKEL